MASAIFHPFSRLPREIREQIWLLTGNHQIPIELCVRMRDRFQHIEDDHEREKALDESSELQYGTKPWPAVSSCREARQALRRLFITPTSVHAPVPQWVNWDVAMVSCDALDIQRLADSPLGPKVINITIPGGCPEFLIRPDYGPRPFPILTTEFESLRSILLLPWALASWAEVERTIYFEEDWFYILKDISLETRDANQIMRLRARVGYPDIPEAQWLTSENFLQAKYLGYTWNVREAEELPHIPDTAWQGSDNITELMAPVFIDGDWELQHVGTIADPF